MYILKWFSYVFVCEYILFQILFHYRLLQDIEYSKSPTDIRDRPSRQKVSKVTEILTDTIEQLDLIDIYRSLWASLVAQMVKNLPAMWETWKDWEDPLEKGMATHSRILAWRIPWTEEPGWLESMGHKESDTTEPLAHLQIICECPKDQWFSLNWMGFLL